VKVYAFESREVAYSRLVIFDHVLQFNQGTFIVRTVSFFFSEPVSCKGKGPHKYLEFLIIGRQLARQEKYF
jgi:hypothetical protein